MDRKPIVHEQPLDPQHDKQYMLRVQKMLDNERERYMQKNSPANLDECKKRRKKI